VWLKSRLNRGETDASDAEGIPLLEQEGWLRTEKKAAKPPFESADGVGHSDRTTRPAFNGCLAIICLLARPPLLYQEGNTSSLVQLLAACWVTVLPRHFSPTFLHQGVTVGPARSRVL